MSNCTNEVICCFKGESEIIFTIAFLNIHLGKNMELLELEMRARAIKSLLNVEKDPDADTPETDKPAKSNSSNAAKPETEKAVKPESSNAKKPATEKISLVIKPPEVAQKEKVLTAAELAKQKKEAEDKEAMRCQCFRSFFLRH
jgi:hypothetical protein